MNGDRVLQERLTVLMQRYDKPGPRYTSYPTAPIFSRQYGADQYLGDLRNTNSADASTDLSLYLHFPFCDTLCYFCGCTTVITQNRQRIEEYLIYLKKEIDLLAAQISPARKVVQMHWGGGTPTYLQPGEIRDITAYIQERFRFDERAEVSVEVDPRELTFEHMQALRESGFNRISLGVQDFNERVQKAINRHQTEQLTRDTIAWSRQLGFTSLNLDLIYGLPLQTADSFMQTLDKVIEIAPDRIAVYNFAYVPWMKPHQKLIHREDLPSPDLKLELLLLTIEKLVQGGYVYIGMDHFAKAQDELTIAQKAKTLHRNFQGYSTKAGCDLLGLGMSAISHFGANYAQNAKTLPEYYRALEAGKFATELGYQMSSDDRLRKHIIMRLMCDLTLSVRSVEEKFNIVFDDYFADALDQLQPLISDGLIVRTPAALEVTMEGRLFLRNIAMCFDAYLGKMQKEKPIFSRTV